MIHQDFFQITRFPSHEVTIGNRPVGGTNPIRIQSMTNTNTLDVRATVEQCIRIIEAGADYVRMSAPNVKAAHALKEISEQIRRAGFSHPLIADIHFNPEVALVAARYVEKVRINPGNYTISTGDKKIHYTTEDTLREKEVILQRLKPLVDCCRENGTAIRIGTNLGSLSPRIIAQYGNTPEGMVNATFEFLEIFSHLDFDNLVISLKASKPLIMVQAYELMVEKMLQHNMSYPLHIGITEAGEGENGRIKSALGICSLLNKGIGDTVRVSLTEDPAREIPFAMKLSSLFQIPFAVKAPDSPYVLSRTTPAEKEIFFPGSKLKAIVIENLGTTEVLEKDDPENITRSGTTVKLTETDRKPDYYFCTDTAALPSHLPGNFLVDAHLLTDNFPKGAIPLIDCNQQDPQKPLPTVARFFLKASCTGTTPDISRMNKHGILGLIVDIEPCMDFDPSPWVEFSQQNEIPLILRVCFQTADPDELISHMAIFTGNLLLEKKIHGIWLHAPAAAGSITEIAFGFLQSAGIRITKTEFISCPTCARTSFDLEKVLKEVQQYTSNLPGLKIAVMGCVVNGPGEMADADFGFVGTGAGKLHLYKSGKPVVKNIHPDQAAPALLKILRENGYIDHE